MNFIAQQINKLRQLTELDLQSNWLITAENLAQPPQSVLQDWQTGIVNEQNYLVWEKGGKVSWFSQEIIVPESLNHYPLAGLSLRIALTWWAELAQIFVNGQLVAEGDLFDSSTRILLTDNAKTGQQFLVSLKLISPQHDIGGLMISRCLYENDYHNIDPSFVANELTVLHRYIKTFTPEKEHFLSEQVKQIDWEKVKSQTLFNQSLEKLRQNLLPLSDSIKQRQFYLLGHAHLDMAWLWTISETYQVAQRTFKSVLNLQKTAKNLIFGQTTAYLYHWLEQNNYQLFKQIQEVVKQGKWEILGGMWVEPEVNLINGESLARQLLYGQQYFLAKFGQYNRVAWLPDTFGFPGQLPQFLQLAEIDYFVTGKLHWNDTTKFPHGCFWWQSPDGSRIFTVMSPPNLTGVMDTNPITMINYSLSWETQTGLKDIFWLPGVGDHGGGPTRDMLEVAQRYQQSPFFPKLKFSTASEYLDTISAIAPDKLPVWSSELYLELHRGCYTTHGEQKRYNRYCEKLLYQAELFSTIATVLIDQFAQKYSNILNLNNYNAINNKFKQEDFNKGNIRYTIKELWQKVLLNQFHDILPGTSITEVFTEANQLWQEVIRQGENILNQSLAIISSLVKLPPSSSENSQTIMVFNSLNWSRNELVELDLEGDKYEVFDSSGHQVKTQVDSEGKLLFYVENIGSIGYQVFCLVPREEPDVNYHQFPEQFILENNLLRVEINSVTGNLKSVYDLSNQREVLQEEGNQLQLFKDEGQYWDAWNINPNYEQYPLDNPHLTSIHWLEKGALRQIIRVVKTFNKSEFIQDYILTVNSSLLIIKNQVNWQETHTLLKVKFPLTISSDFATYEIACGAIQRTTKPQTEAEKAQWEVYAHHWADLSNDDYGVSLLNDCKYGYDAQPNQLRLSLLRSPRWPDGESDQGFHQFTYALYAHQKDWKKAKTVQKGYELNMPLQVRLIPGNQSQLACLPTQAELLNLGGENLILMALKPGEKDLDQLILRCYECHQEETDLKLGGELNLVIQNKLNLLENELNQKNYFQVKPAEVITVTLTLTR
jgi:alpha-mannosidase